MENQVTNDAVVIPDEKHDYHGHPNYMMIFLLLLGLFGVSLIAGYLFSPVAAVAIIFATAVWKIALVMRNFMHLKFEPYLVWIGVIAVLFILVAFFFGVHIDITAVTREVVPR